MTDATYVLDPDDTQLKALAAYVAAYREALNWLGPQIFSARETDQVRLHHLYYANLRDRFDLPAQSAVLAIRHAARLCRRATVVPVLPQNLAVPYDRHLYNLKGVDRLSLATLEGRVVVPCALLGYGANDQIAAEAELFHAEGEWQFSVRTKLPIGVINQVARRKEPTMSDKLLNRISRLVSGVAHSAIAAAEQAAPAAVMEQAIRDIDEATSDVREEIGKCEASKFNLEKTISELKSEHASLDEKTATALDAGNESLAEAGVGRQLDIENQVALLERSLADVDEDVAKFTESLNALAASRREAHARLRDLKAAPAPGQSGSGKKGKTSSKAADAMNAAKRIGEDLTGVPGSVGKTNAKELEELEELHRKKLIQERLEKAKSDRGKS